MLHTAGMRASAGKIHGAFAGCFDWPQWELSMKYMQSLHVDLYHFCSCRLLFHMFLSIFTAVVISTGWWLGGQPKKSKGASWAPETQITYWLCLSLNYTKKFARTRAHAWYILHGRINCASWWYCIHLDVGAATKTTINASNAGVSAGGVLYGGIIAVYYQYIAMRRDDRHN